MWTKAFWKRAVERMLRAAAAVFVGMSAGPQIGAVLAGKADLQTINWEYVGGAAGVGMLVSLCLSLLATRKGDPEDPSLVG